MLLKETFRELLKRYTESNSVVTHLWSEIEQNYSSKKRFYHTLLHLNNLLQELIEVKTELKSWDTILFSLFYHDIIYDPLKTNNEEKSATLAQKRMKEISVSLEVIEVCKSQILATKMHSDNPDSDTNYFTDADLSILGQTWEVYAEYYKNVRKEYSIYPNLIYNAGRRKVINRFLSMNKIFQTPYFFNEYEQQAKQNLRKEIDLL